MVAPWTSADFLFPYEYSLTFWWNNLKLVLQADIQNIKVHFVDEIDLLNCFKMEAFLNT